MIVLTMTIGDGARVHRAYEIGGAFNTACSRYTRHAPRVTRRPADAVTCLACLRAIARGVDRDTENEAWLETVRRHTR